MATSDGILPAQVLRTLDEIGKADVLVGVPSFENETTIGGVVTAVEAGLRKPEKAEARIEAGTDVAVERKPHLVERWAALGVPPRSLRDQPVP